jgi:hypothetical protein
LNLLDKVSNKNHRDALLDSMLRYLADEGIDMTEEGLLDAPSSLYHMVQVYVLKYGTAEWLPQRLRCTASGTWQNGPPPV